MPNLKDIRRRIASVKNTQKITKSMKMVSAAKLRRAEEAAERSKPYASRLAGTLRRLASGLEDVEHPLLEKREVRSTEWIVVTSDRGLCGGFNSQLLRLTEKELAGVPAEDVTLSLWVVGRKARDHFKRRVWEMAGEATGFTASPSHGDALELAQRAIERFSAGEVDEVVLVYNEFVSKATQRPVVTKLLPLTSDELEGEEEEAAVEGHEPIFEPARDEMLAVLLPKQLVSQVHQALLESAAGEHAARMAAMDAATNNAGEMIDSLTLKFNKARQAAITTELMEIVSGAEALSQA